MYLPGSHRNWHVQGDCHVTDAGITVLMDPAAPPHPLHTLALSNMSQLTDAAVAAIAGSRFQGLEDLQVTGQGVTVEGFF